MRKLFFLFSLVAFISACNTSRTTTKSTETNSSSMMYRRKITDYAQKYVGTTYKYAGTSPSTGFDCSGFTSYVLKEFKVKASPSSAVQSTEGRKKPLDKLLPGDLVFFGDETRIQHVAMVVKNSKEGIVCVHSTTSKGVIVENITTSNYWKPKILFGRDLISK